MKAVVMEGRKNGGECISDKGYYQIWIKEQGIGETF